jgi:hypothetical protein
MRVSDLQRPPRVVKSEQKECLVLATKYGRLNGPTLR